MPSSEWERVALGQILTQVADEVSVQDATPYKQVTVRMHNKGLILRQRVDGREIKTKRQFGVRAGQFVFSRIDARNGAMGLVPPELDGAIVSNDFPVFTIDSDQVAPDLFRYYVSTAPFLDACLAQSKGTSNRRRLKEQDFLEIGMPLPPLDEQQRIVARIDPLAARIAEARELQARAAEEAEAYMPALVTKLLDSLSKTTETAELLDLCEFHGGTQPAKSEFRYEPADGYVRFLQIRDYSSDDFRTYIPVSRKNRLARPGDILLGRYGASLGKILRGKEGAYNVAMCKVTPKVSEIDIDFLATSLAYGPLQTRLRENRRSAQVGFNKEDLRGVRCPVPPSHEQRRVVSLVNSAQRCIDALRELQGQTQAELDALLPSILDKAFRGEL